MVFVGLGVGDGQWLGVAVASWTAFESEPGGAAVLSTYIDTKIVNGPCWVAEVTVNETRTVFSFRLSLRADESLVDGYRWFSHGVKGASG